jgi:hypothetical protein
MAQSVREWIIVLWPAFIAACALEMLVFAGFDPHDTQLFGLSLQGDRELVYTAAFFAFWAVTTVSGVITWLLAQPVLPLNAAQVGLNGRTDDHSERASPPKR